MRFPDCFSYPGKKNRLHPLSGLHEFASPRMHPHPSLLLLFTAFSAIFLPPGSASILKSKSPPSSELATTGTRSTGSNPSTNALLPRAPGQEGDTPFARCSCRSAVASWWDCHIYQILNWPTEQNVILRLNDELIKCGTFFFGLRKYYIPERKSGLGAFAFFELPFVHRNSCWKRAIASALGTTGVACSFDHFNSDDVPPWWEDMNRQGRGYKRPPIDSRW